MRYRITAHRRKDTVLSTGRIEHQMMDPQHFNADGLSEMRAALLKAQGTRFCYRVSVSTYIAMFIRDDKGQWHEVNPLG